MFPTAGYFRSTNCPFFVHGLCHRPYCHFRHSKPGLKVSKSKISPHKHKTEERHKVGDHVQHASKVTSSDVKTGNSHKAQDEKKDNTSTTTTVKSILKRPNEEISKQSTVEDSSTVDSFDKISTMDISAGTDENSIESFDDTEQPIASLTDEEKQIIGLMSHPPSMSQNLGFEKSSDAIIAPVSNAISDSSSFDSNTCAVTSIQNEAVVSSEKPCNVNLTDALKEVHADVKKDTTEKALLCSEFKEEMADKVPADSSNDCVMEKHDITVTEEKSDKILSKKRKSVQLKTSTTTKKTSLKGSTKEVSLFDAISKKRKSQQLPCVTDCFSSDSLAKDAEEVKEFKSLKGNEGCIIQEINTLDQFLKSASKPYQEIERSKKTLSLGKDDTHQDKAFIIPKKQKLVVESTVTLKRKLPVKEFSVENTHIPKKKVQSHVNISEAEINFFSPAKKSHKSSKVEKQKKNPEKTSPVKTSKVIKLEPRGSDKSKDLKQKFSKGVTIMISDDSEAFSPANYDSSSEEESHLKRIWDEYEPQNEFALVDDSPVKSQRQELQRKRTPPAAVIMATVDEKQSSMADTLGLRKKQRVAHSANHERRRTSSNANPIRRYPKTLAAIQKKEEFAASSSSMELSVKAATTSYKPTKQRVAHVLKHSAPVGSLPRPRIPVEYGAKVPQNQRQRYLDRIIDEYLRIYPTEKEAFEQAVEEEQTLYERSTRRQVYLNLCVNAIKKLRDMKPQEISTTSPVKTEKRVAVTKILPSGAVVISTKSPVKQDQPVMPASGHLTEDVMYDFLSNYLMSEDDLVENGYPRPSQTSPGKAVFKTNKEQPSKDPSRRICRRCGKPFVVLEDGVYLTKEECVYHAGKLFRRRGEQSYSCCQGDAGTPGCCVGKVHVSDETCNTDGFMTTIVSPLLADQPKKIFAMDCEMCYTTGGLELTRITVVNWNLEGVYDTFVMPERTIVDYNTRFSGVTEELLRGVTTTIREVQAVLLSMIHKDTILVGHSLESDLKATKLMHSKVVDTSVVFPHRLGRPYKRALRNLMADYLKKIIQDSVAGHDSHEDARSCLELMRFKVKEDMKKKTRHKSPRLSLG